MKIVLVILSLAILFSCNSDKSSVIDGNWYTCTHKGGYAEMFVKDGKYKYSCDFDLVTNWQDFEIVGDTFIQYERSDEFNSVSSIKNLFSFSNNNLVINDITNDVTYIYSPIMQTVKHLNNNTELNKDTKVRALEIKCPDMRTPEEIREDSALFDFNIRY